MKRAISQQSQFVILCVFFLLVLNLSRSADARIFSSWLLAATGQSAAGQPPPGPPRQGAKPQSAQERGQKVKEAPKPEQPANDRGTVPAASNAAGPQNLALVIGVSKYQNLPQGMQLKYAD